MMITTGDCYKKGVLIVLHLANPKTYCRLHDKWGERETQGLVGI